jgi:hypothetical protein
VFKRRAGRTASILCERRETMRAYRLFLLNRSDRISSADVLECTDDGEAQRQAELRLPQLPSGAGLEVWDGGRRVHRVAPAAE